jgi:hypothetical protein
LTLWSAKFLDPLPQDSKRRKGRAQTLILTGF